MSNENAPFQARVRPWLLECFGQEIADDVVERNHRFIEEALELVQSLGCSSDDAHALVDYVYGRDVGVPPQEVGGVMVTLAALCLASDLDMHQAGEVELERVWTKVDKIRAKQAAKPRGSALPQAWPRTCTETEANALVAAALREAAFAAFHACKATGAGYRDENERLLQRAENEMRLETRKAILAIINTDHAAALDKLLADARREALERAAEIVSGVGETAHDAIAWVIDDIEDAILAEMEKPND